MALPWEECNLTPEQRDVMIRHRVRDMLNNEGLLTAAKAAVARLERRNYAAGPSRRLIADLSSFTDLTQPAAATAVGGALWG